MQLFTKPHPFHLQSVASYDFAKHGKALVLYDSGIVDHAQTLDQILTDQNVEHVLQPIPSGEEAKRHTYLGRYYTYLGMREFDYIIGLGGGSTGDVAGYLATTYKDGVDLVQIPTTLLAMVDSSIGGKNGLNINEKKNYIRKIRQPTSVIADAAYLEYQSNEPTVMAYSEIVKSAMIADESLLSYLEENHSRRDNEHWNHVIEQTARIKARIVSSESRDVGLRHILNYGHTVAHAIEAESRYTIGHDEAVSIGIAIEGGISVALGRLPQDQFERQVSLQHAMGLPTTSPYAMSDLIPHMRNDKKSIAGEIRCVVLKQIGEPLEVLNRYSHEIEPELFLAAKPI